MEVVVDKIKDLSPDQISAQALLDNALKDPIEWSTISGQGTPESGADNTGKHIYLENSAPTTAKEGDLYFDSSNNNNPYKLINGVWVSVRDGLIMSAALQGWANNLIFSSDDYNTVSWLTGTIALSNGNTYSISAGNTGNIAAVTYIFLDIGVSSTVLQTTTTVANSVGVNRILLAVARPNTDITKKAEFQIYGGYGQSVVITADVIAANTITGNEIAANTITANKLNVATLSAITADLGTITAGTITGGIFQTAATGARTVFNSSGIAGYDATTQRYNLGNDGSGWLGAATTIAWTTLGAVTIGSWSVSSAAIYLNGAADANSAGMAPADYPFYAGKKYVDRATAPFRVTPAGALYASSATISGAVTTMAGSSLDGQYLGAATVSSAAANLALRGWTITCVFTVTDSDTVAWGAGTFTASDTTAYSIGAGNTGNMTAKTYIYLDIAVSTTALQTTTTAATAIGNGKVLIGWAQNNTTEAIFQLYGGIGGMNIDAASIVAGSITANEIAAATITANKLNVATLSSITADIGTITAGSINIASGNIYLDGTTKAFSINNATFGNQGIQLQYNAGTPRAYIGDGANQYFQFDGANISVGGSINPYITLTAGENLLRGQAIYQADDGKMYKTDGAVSGISERFRGFVKDISVLKGTTGNVQIMGEFTNLSSLTAYNLQYLSSGTVDASETSHESATGSIYGDEWYGEVFTTSANMVRLTSVKLGLKKGGTPTGTLTVAIRATSGGKPTGANVYSSTMNVALLTTSYLDYTFEFDKLLSASTAYAIIVYQSAGDSGNYVLMQIHSIGGGGGWVYSTDGGSNWTADATKDIYFSAFRGSGAISTTPEIYTKKVGFSTATTKIDMIKN